jgi:hypothetical protein
MKSCYFSVLALVVWSSLAAAQPALNVTAQPQSATEMQQVSPPPAQPIK